MAQTRAAVWLASAALILAVALAVSGSLRSLIRHDYDQASGKQAPLYAKDDAWSAWLAPESVCPGGEATDAPQTEVTTMLCLINYARAHEGLGPVALISSLNAASVAKAGDIARCGKFEHAACGK